MGVPVFPITLRGNATKAIFDTGAHLSYISLEIVAGERSSGERNDFYPLVGTFTAPTYLVSTSLDDTPIDIEYGILPESLQMMLGMAMAMSESSAVVGTQLLEFFDCTISWARSAISWTRTRHHTKEH